MLYLPYQPLLIPQYPHPYRTALNLTDSSPHPLLNSWKTNYSTDSTHTSTYSHVHIYDLKYKQYITSPPPDCTHYLYPHLNKLRKPITTHTLKHNILPCSFHAVLPLSILIIQYIKSHTHTDALIYHHHRPHELSRKIVNRHTLTDATISTLP